MTDQRYRDINIKNGDQFKYNQTKSNNKVSANQTSQSMRNGDFSANRANQRQDEDGKFNHTESKRTKRLFDEQPKLHHNKSNTAEQTLNQENKKQFRTYGSNQHSANRYSRQQSNQQMKLSPKVKTIGLNGQGSTLGNDQTIQDAQQQPTQSMQELLFKTKGMFREQMLQNFSYIKDLCTLPDTTSEDFKKSKDFQKMMDDITQSDKLLYPPNSQLKERVRMKSASESFVKFQDLLQVNIEQAFRASGLVSKCMELERLNAFLYQLLVDVEQHPPSTMRGRTNSSQRQDSSRMGSKSGSVDDEPTASPVQGIEKQQSYFEQNYELLKIEILKRLKKDLHLQTIKWHPNKEGGTNNFDYFANRHEFNQDWRTDHQCTPDQLIKDEDLFRTIRSEVVGVLDNQNNSYQMQYNQKVQQIQNINFELRKSCLKELHLMRQTYFLKNAQHIDAETALKYSKVQLFQFDEGLDEQICDLLNTKIKQITVEFVAQITEQQSALEKQRDLINKYKALSPKVFKLAELSLSEVFEALSKIHKDSFKIFHTLLRCYPTNYFVGVIEDTFGAFFDEKGEAKLHQRLERIQVDMRQEVGAIAEQVKLEKAKLNSINADQSAYILEINKAHMECEGKLAKALEPKVRQAVAAERTRLKIEHKLSSRMLEERCERNKQKYNQLKELHFDNECRLAFFKWKVLIASMKKLSAYDARDLLKTLTKQDKQKMQNSLEAREQKNCSLRSLVEATQQQLFTLQERYDEVYLANIELQMKYDSQQSAYSELFHRTHSTLIPKITELEQERQSLDNELKASLNLVKSLQTNNILIEEKYNVRGQKKHIDPKERVLLRIYNEFDIQCESTRVLFNKIVQQALLEDPGLFKPLIPNEKQKRKHAGCQGHSRPTSPEPTFLPEKFDLTKVHQNLREVECQTYFQNTNLRIEVVGRDDQLEKCAHHPKPMTREVETQTDADWELWDELVQAHHIYREMLQSEQFDESDFPMVNLNIMPKKIRTSAESPDNISNVFHYTSSKARSRQTFGERRRKPRSGATLRGRGSSSPSPQSLVASQDEMNNPEMHVKTHKLPKYTDSSYHPGQDEDEDEFSEEQNGSESYDKNEQNYDRKSRDQWASKNIKSSQYKIRNSNSEDRRFKDQLRAYAQQRRLILKIEQELSQLEPQERFDRVRFVFETNIDIIEIMKQKEPQLYKDALLQLKQKMVTDNGKVHNIDSNPMKMLWRGTLLEESAIQLKRLYPRNQPDVFARLHKVLDDKEQTRMKTLLESNNLRWEKKFNSTTATSGDFTNLFAQIHRAKTGKNQQNLLDAQKELMYYIDLKQRERAQSAGRQRKKTSLKQFENDFSNTLQRQESSSQERGTTANMVSSSQPKDLKMQGFNKQQQFGHWSIPQARETNTLVQQHIDSNAISQLSGQQRDKLLLLKQQEQFLKNKRQQQYYASIEHPSSNKVFAVPVKRHRQSLTVTLQKIKKDYQQAHIAGSKVRQSDIFKKPINDQLLNLDLAMAQNQTLSLSHFQQSNQESGKVSKSNSQNNLKQSEFIQIREISNNVDSLLGQKSKPDLVLHQVQDDQGTKNQVSSMSQRPSNQGGNSPNADTMGEPTQRMEFSAIYNNSTSNGQLNNASQKLPQKQQKKLKRTQNKQPPQFENQVLRSSSLSNTESRSVQQINQIQGSIEGMTDQQFKQNQTRQFVQNDEEKIIQIDKSDEKQYYSTLQRPNKDQSQQARAEQSNDGSKSQLIPSNKQNEHAEQQVDEVTLEQASLDLFPERDSIVNIPLEVGKHGMHAKIKVHETMPTGQHRESDQEQRQNQGSSCEIILIPRQSTDEKSRKDVSEVRHRGSLMPSNQSMIDVYGSPGANERNGPECQTEASKFKSRRGQNLREKKSSKVLQHPSQKYHYPPQYKLQSATRHINPNTKVKVSYKRVRPQTSKQNGRNRKLVRYREENLNTKKSLTSELMKDFERQDKKLSMLNINDQSSTSLIQSNIKRNTQPATLREFKMPSHDQASMTFDSSTPLPHCSELSKSDPISAFNKNNKKVSAFIHRISLPGTPKLNGMIAEDQKQVSFGVPEINPPSAFDINTPDNEAQRNMHGFMNTNLMRTSSLLIVENSNDQQQQKFQSKDQHELTSSQIQGKYCTTGSVTEAISNMDQKMQQAGTSNELDLNSNIKIHSLTNVINSPNTHSSEIQELRLPEQILQITSNQNTIHRSDAVSQGFSLRKHATGGGGDEDATARVKQTSTQKASKGFRGAFKNRINHYAVNRYSNRKHILNYKNCDLYHFDKIQTLHSTTKNSASQDQNPIRQQSANEIEGRFSTIRGVQKNQTMAHRNTMGLNALQSMVHHVPTISTSQDRQSQARQANNQDDKSSINFTGSIQQVQYSSQNQLISAQIVKNKF